MRKQNWILPAALVAMAIAAPAAQQARAPRAIRLEFPEVGDLTGLSVRYFLVGPFGGFGSSVRTEANVRTYDLEAWQGGQPARTLKAIIYCPGRRFVLISESGFGNDQAKPVPVRFETLGSVPLAGRVTGAALSRLQVEVTYLATWGHSFFGIYDGAVASFRVGSAELKPDGSFSLLVPDFASDSVVARYSPSERGWFQLVAREPTTGNIAFFLRSNDKASALMGVPIATAYPGVLQFDVVK